jgi:creatinine amidohydrolase
MQNILLILICGATAIANAQSSKPDDIVSTRDLDRINWMEFQEVVPGRIDTVLLPTGTLEPHGVINNGADNTAPAAMARAIAQRVNAMVAPTLAYGITGSLEGYPGAFRISKETYKPFVREIMEGLLTVGLWNAELEKSEKGFYAMSFVLSLFAAIAVQKNTRDIKTSKTE